MAYTVKICRHCQWLRQFCTPTRASYAGHGQLILDSDLRQAYAAHHPQLPEFMAAAAVAPTHPASASAGGTGARRASLCPDVTGLQQAAFNPDAARPFGRRVPAAPAVADSRGRVRALQPLVAPRTKGCKAAISEIGASFSPKSPHQRVPTPAGGVSPPAPTPGETPGELANETPTLQRRRADILALCGAEGSELDAVLPEATAVHIFIASY